MNLSQHRTLALGLFLGALVFVIDFLTPLGVAVGVLYLAVIPVALLSGRRADVVILAAVSTALVLLGRFATADHVTPMPWVNVNRGISFVAIWSVAALILRHLARTEEMARARAQSNALFRRSLEAAPDGMLVVDEDGRIRLANRTAERMFGFEPGTLVGSSMEALVPELQRRKHAEHVAAFFRAPIAKAMGEGRVIEACKADGALFHAEILLSPLGGTSTSIIVAVRNVDSRQKLEERLRSTQRMEAIGKLAGGVAHDFNNLLTVILTSIELSLDELPRDSSTHAELMEASVAGKRAASLTKQLLAFSRKQIVQLRVLNANQLLFEMHKMLRRILGENIELVTLPDAELWSVECDPSCLEQIVLNLTVNARDAMPHGGKLLFETSNVALDEDYAREHPDVRSGEYILLAVTDTGIGMTSDVMARVFEPFFTTKPVGAGTGLGLATVYGIVKQAGGHVWVYSEPGNGTNFKVYLPRAHKPAESISIRPDSPRPIGGDETLLVVEDEFNVRRVIVQTLRRYGYVVYEAGNGVEAMLKLDATELHVDLLITDVVMPQMGGRELARRVLARYPELPVLYTSGYTENAIVHNGALDVGLALLQKPFLPGTLARRVRAILDETRALRAREPS